MDFTKLKEQGLAYLEKGKEIALDLTEKGQTQAKVMNCQVKLQKAQRQLGELVYSLAKGKEENKPLVDQYIDNIAAIEAEIQQLKAGTAQSETEPEVVEDAPEVYVVDETPVEQYVAVPMDDVAPEEAVVEDVAEGAEGAEDEEDEEEPNA